MTDAQIDQQPPPADPLPEVATLQLSDLRAALRAGLADFREVPLYGLAFSAVYVLGGFLMLWLGAGHVTWTLATSLGFPLAAPFAAVGLYEVSRRIEAGEPLAWGPVLGVIWAERGRQMPWMGWIILVFFLFWTFISHLIFALFMGLSAITNISQDFGMLFTGAGLRMIAAEVVVGGAMAFLLFAITVVSLPLLLEKEIDFASAIILSLKAVRRNLSVMLVWAALVATLTFVALLPWFLGLIVVLPVLGHATWHLYRRALVPSG